MKKQPLSLEEMLARRAQEKEAEAKVVYMSHTCHHQPSFGGSQIMTAVKNTAFMNISLFFASS